MYKTDILLVYICLELVPKAEPIQDCNLELRNNQFC